MLNVKNLLRNFFLRNFNLKLKIIIWNDNFELKFKFFKRFFLHLTLIFFEFILNIQ